MIRIICTNMTTLAPAPTSLCSTPASTHPTATLAAAHSAFAHSSRAMMRTIAKTYTVMVRGIVDERCRWQLRCDRVTRGGDRGRDDIRRGKECDFVGSQRCGLQFACFCSRFILILLIEFYCCCMVVVSTDVVDIYCALWYIHLLWYLL